MLWIRPRTNSTRQTCYCDFPSPVYLINRQYTCTHSTLTWIYVWMIEWQLKGCYFVRESNFSLGCLERALWKRSPTDEGLEELQETARLQERHLMPSTTDGHKCKSAVNHRTPTHLHISTHIKFLFARLQDVSELYLGQCWTSSQTNWEAYLWWFKCLDKEKMRWESSSRKSIMTEYKKW